ncbi:uncharacterized protein LOC130301099 isoform X2 [Hyla sarda]|uniref:uncharacterized protein LOC130301099 isoform X2 n=1 Tax=Hyla sarda TaxID=327740 RepID=UPI0024C282EC|nr:uncharacterized protein LOC130301099 isoform X2 [Hyla sarda]
MPRTPLTCPICYKTKKTLKKHLRKKCMKNRSDEEIKATFAEAKSNLAKVAAKGLAIKFNEVAELVCGKKCQKNVIKLLSDRGFMIYNSPLVTSNGKKHKKKRRKGKKCGQPTKENPGCEHLSSQLQNKAVKKKQGAVVICDSATKEKERKERDTKTVIIEPNYKWNHPLRKKMADAGMYKRHSVELEPLAGFQKFLSKTLRIVRYKQEVENVARFLFFANKKKPALDFIYNIEKSYDYFDKLLEIGNTHQTVFNYLKNVKRFVSYLMNATSLVFRDKETYSAAGIYLSQLGIFQKRLRKGIAKECVMKKEKLLSEKVKRPDELALVLTNAEPAFKKAIQMAENSDTLLKKEKLIILYFLECIIIFRKFQRPGVIENMTVDEWKRRSAYHEDHVGISVHEHKTGAHQIAVVILSKEEERHLHRIVPHLKLPAGLCLVFQSSSKNSA